MVVGMKMLTTFAVVVVMLNAAVGCGAAEAPAEGPLELTWETLGAFLDAEAEAGFTGAVRVVREGEVVVDRGYGLANRELGIPITPATVFAVGSQPIDFTHAAILLLAQEEMLDLAAPITRFFEDVPPDKRAITVEHLMTGASGLPDFHDRPGDRDPDHAWIDRDEAVRRILSSPLLFEPGTAREHSHSAWGLLSAIVEIVSGSTYQEFTREHLFGPAGMDDTGFNGEPVPCGRLAVGYGERSDGEVNAPPFWGPTSWLVLGSGGQTSTTGDTSRFLDAMREGRILDPEWAQRFFGPGPGANRNGDSYGFEMFVFHTPMATTHAVLITNAFRPNPETGAPPPFERVARAVGELVLDRPRPRFSLGIEMAPSPDGGVEIVAVRPGSAAAGGGLRPGDVLVAAGGTPFGPDPLAVLDPFLQSGDPIQFTVRRGGATVELTVHPAPADG
jgi:CubicO group peptidase (beta-lactamase class C family)